MKYLKNHHVYDTFTRKKDVIRYLQWSVTAKEGEIVPQDIIRLIKKAEQKLGVVIYFIDRNDTGERIYDNGRQNT